MTMAHTTTSLPLPAALLPALTSGRGQTACGRVAALESDGSVRVDAGDGTSLRCDRLTVTEGPPLRLDVGDMVLVWTASRSAEPSVVLGRVGPSSAPAPEPRTPDTPDATTVPDELVIEAGRSLTLRVGDGSITIRADGRILIKGRDLVSHAQRTNRIRGGSVAIN